MRYEYAFLRIDILRRYIDISGLMHPARGHASDLQVDFNFHHSIASPLHWWRLRCVSSYTARMSAKRLWRGIGLCRKSS